MTMLPVGAKVTADTTSFVTGFESATRALSSFRTGTLAAQAGIATLIGVGGMGMAVDAAIDFQTEITKLNTLVGLSQQETNEMSDAILRLSGELGALPQEMAQAAFAITSGGARGAEAIEILAQSAKASQLGLGDMTAIGRLATAALQAFGDQGLTATDAIDVLVGTVRAGNLEASELSGSLGRVMGTAAAMGVTFQDVGAFVATYTRLGVNAATATTSLNATLNTIIKPTDDARKAFDAIGIPIDEMRRRIRENGLNDALIDLTEALNGNLDLIGDAIPNVRALSGVLGTAGVQTDALRQITQDLNMVMGTTNEGFKTYEQTGKAAFDELRAAAQALKISIGNEALPAVTAAVGFLADHLQVAAQGFGMLLSAVTFNGLVRLATLLFTAGSAARGLAAAMALAGGWPGIIAAAAGALAVYLVPRLLEADDAAARLTESVKNAFRPPDVSNLSLKEIDAQLELARKRQDIFKTGLEQNPANDANREALANVSRTIQVLEAQRRILIATQNEENDATETGTRRTEDAEEAVQDYIAALQKQRDELVLTKKEQREKELAALSLTDAEKEQVRELWREVDVYERAAEMTRRANAAMEDRERLLNRMKQAQYQKDMQEYRKALAEWQAEMNEVTQAASRMADAVGDAFMELDISVQGVVIAVRDAVSAILDELARLAIRKSITEPLLEVFASFLSAQFGVGGAPTAPTAPGAAFGGVVRAGQARIVGELGRELFVPEVAGAIVPMSGPGAVGAGGGPTIVVRQNITFAPQFVDGQDGERWLRSQSGTVTKIVADAARSSTQVARALTGSRR